MDKGGILFFLFIIIGISYIIYESVPGKYIKLEENFGGFKNRSLVRFEYEKSPLHTILYGGTDTGKIYFIRQYLKLYSVQNQDLRTDEVRGEPSSLVIHEQIWFTEQNQDQNRDQNQNQDLRSSLLNHEQSSFANLRSSFTDQAKNLIIVCKDDIDWIDPESNKFYTGFKKCDINMITKIICINFKIVL